jgi:hypothetical protein
MTLEMLGVVLVSSFEINNKLKQCFLSALRISVPQNLRSKELTIDLARKLMSISTIVSVGRYRQYCHYCGDGLNIEMILDLGTKVFKARIYGSSERTYMINEIL